MTVPSCWQCKNRILPPWSEFTMFSVLSLMYAVSPPTRWDTRVQHGTHHAFWCSLYTVYNPVSGAYSIPMYYLYKCKVDFYTEVKIHSSTFLGKQDCYWSVTWMNHVIKLVLENRVAISWTTIFHLFSFPISDYHPIHMAKLQPGATCKCTISWNHISVHATPFFFRTQIASTCSCSMLPLAAVLSIICECVPALVPSTGNEKLNKTQILFQGFSQSPWIKTTVTSFSSCP